MQCCCLSDSYSCDGGHQHEDPHGNVGYSEQFLKQLRAVMLQTSGVGRFVLPVVKVGARSGEIGSERKQITAKEVPSAHRQNWKGTGCKTSRTDGARAGIGRREMARSTLMHECRRQP